MIDDLLFCCGRLCCFSTPPNDGRKTADVHKSGRTDANCCALKIFGCVSVLGKVLNMLYITLYISADSVIWGDGCSTVDTTVE